MARPRRRILGSVLLFLAGWACGGGGAGTVSAAMQLIELGGASLADMLAQAGPPAIAPGFGIAERVADDGARHFSLTVAAENPPSPEDAAAPRSGANSPTRCSPHTAPAHGRSPRCGGSGHGPPPA